MKIWAVLCWLGVGLCERCRRLPGEQNVALLGEAVQSSTYIYYSVAQNAIDGSKSNFFNLKTCILSEYQNQPWWRVDLRNFYSVSSVTIIPLAGWGVMIEGAEVRVGNSLRDEGNQNYKCGSIPPLTDDSFPTLCCQGITARYVNVVIPDKPQYLVFCEVEVYAVPLRCAHLTGEQNVTLNTVASQSSTEDELGLALNAVDGNRDDIYDHGSCSQTELQFWPWWRVDLGFTHLVTTVTIVNRKDCCHEDLRGAEVRLGDSVLNAGRDNYRCGVIISTGPGSVHTVCCDGRKGRYVTITIPEHQRHLTLCEVEISAVPLPSCFPNYFTEVNVAHLGTAVQSSNESSQGAALHGVDDNYSPSYFHGSCTSTGRQNNPWWRLELPGIYAVTLVTVVNRADDCCWKDLKGAEVRAGELLERHGNINPRCGQVTHATRGSFHMFCCCGKTARYVNIVLPGRSRVLSLCEVDVLGVPISEGSVRILGDGNVALQGEAVQSSTYNSIGDAENAIDNNWSAALYEASCTLTEHQPAPWWRVDLRKKYRVSAVVVKNRQDCCFRRLKGAEVRLGDSLVNNGNDNYRCGVIKGTYLGSVHVLSCAMRVGRYVNVLSRKTTFLTLCEVEVYGVAVPICRRLPGEKNVALLAQTTQSSTFTETGVSLHATDGDRNPFYVMWSCTRTRYQMSPWWRADLKIPVRVSAVVVFNRMDCCHERLMGAEVRLGNSLVNHGNENYRCGIINTTWPGSVHTLCCNGRQGRHVNILILAAEKRILSLCEVEIYAVCPSKVCPRFPRERNIALQGKATQSSTLNAEGRSVNAIDGNSDPNYFIKSCSQTQEEPGAWWRLDLHKRFRISWILIVNRRDCCSGRLRDAEVLLGDGLLEQTDENIWCGTVDKTSPGSIHRFCCYGLPARFVNIHNPNRKEHLTLCEVEVYGIPLLVEQEDISDQVAADVSWSAKEALAEPRSSTSLLFPGPEVDSEPGQTGDPEQPEQADLLSGNGSEGPQSP